ncbi:hypothetical protein [Mycolicibacterium elephantis]|nr:hypothetical protein [Mycolicibacterium elephantis]MCV7219912.1 hypothetical protein [Mycolicibacterium elephantis]
MSRSGVGADVLTDGAVTMHLLADRTPPDVVAGHVAQLMTWALMRP